MGKPVLVVLHKTVPWQYPGGAPISQGSVAAMRLAGGLGSICSSSLPPAGSPSPQDCFIPGNPSPSSWAAFAESSPLEVGSPGEGPRKPRVSAGTRPHPLPLPQAPQGEQGSFPTGLCCCLAPSSGREGEGAAGGRQARAHHRGSGEHPECPGGPLGALLSSPTPPPPSLPFSCFLPLCPGAGPLQP